MNDADELLNDDTPAVNAEIVQDNPSSTSPIDGASVLLNLEQLIKTHITRIDTLKVETKKHKEMLDDILKNDEIYTEHDKKAKEAAKVKATTKWQILKRPNVATVAEKVKNLRQEAKDLEAALSDYLREYERLSGSNEVQGEDGEVREIIYIAKLVKKTSRKK